MGWSDEEGGGFVKEVRGKREEASRGGRKASGGNKASGGRELGDAGEEGGGADS